jgi:hypothetical protein
MNTRPCERLDERARHVVETAWSEAAGLENNVVGTEHLLLALACADGVTARLLAEAGADADAIRGAVVARSGRPRRRPDDHVLLATLGIDLAEVRKRADRTFGADAVARAVSQVRPPRPRRPLRTWISCSTPMPSPRSESPLAGQRLQPIPRVERVLARASRDARPEHVSPQPPTRRSPHRSGARLRAPDRARRGPHRAHVGGPAVARRTRHSRPTRRLIPGIHDDRGRCRRRARATSRAAPTARPGLATSRPGRRPRCVSPRRGGSADPTRSS